MANRFVFEGMQEFREALRNLPMDLRNEGTVIVERAANNAMRETFQAYPISMGRKRRGRFIPGGQLRKGLRIAYESSPFGARAVVRNTAPHAFIFENGTEMRETAQGWKRGSARPGRIFVPIMIKHRRRMNSELIGLLRRAGLIVISDGDLGH